MRTLRFNDNPFSLNKEHHFDTLLRRHFNLLEKANGESIQGDLRFSL